MRALTARGLWPPAALDVPLDDEAAAVRAVGRVRPLVAQHQEGGGYEDALALVAGPAPDL